MATIVGEAGLGPADARALAFAADFERTFIGQGATHRSVQETLERGWRLLDALPPEDLIRLQAATVDRRRRSASDEAPLAGDG